MKAVLFLCTGNYYRSRFAEELFNFLAPVQCPGWAASSRGIAVDLGSNNVGPIAEPTVKALQLRGVSFDRKRARMPLQVTTSDLDAANRIIALKFTEHFPLMQKRFPAWLSTNEYSRIEYWEVHDVDQMSSDKALPLIEERLENLILRLRGGAREDSAPK